MDDRSTQAGWYGRPTWQVIVDERDGTHESALIFEGTVHDPFFVNVFNEIPLRKLIAVVEVKSNFAAVLICVRRV